MEIVDFLKSLAEHGPFVAGTVFGCIISFFLFKLASSEMTERQKIDLEREKELGNQIAIKDKRIDVLHIELAKIKKSKRS